MDRHPAPDPTSPRAAAVYLLRLRPLIAQAVGSHRSFIRALRGLVDDVRRDGPLARARARTIGDEWGVLFDEWLRQLRTIDVPPPCAVCDMEFGRWLEVLGEATRTVGEAGRSGDFSLLRLAHKRLTEARRHARAFNDEHASLVAELRELSDEFAALRRLPVR